ncbi:MAG: hypothetical protein ABFC94_09135 [Syntrophomonas sp.]
MKDLKKQIISYREQVFLCVFVLFVYIILFGNFRKESIDDPYVLSWIYNYLKFKITMSINFGVDAGQPWSGISLFGMTQAYIYGPILNTFGFTPNTAYFVSTILVIIASILWLKIFIHFGINKKVAVTGICLMLLLEPFIFSSNSARSESLTFFLATLSFYLFINKIYIISAILAFVAFETHPMGMISGFYILGYSIAFWNKIEDKKKVLGLLILGGIVGISYYLVLHWNYLIALNQLITKMVWVDNSFLASNTLFKYFFMQRFYRHIPEFVIILISLGIIIRNKEYSNNIPIMKFILCVVIASFIIGRSQETYMIYYYPVLFLLLLIAVESINARKILIVCIILLVIPQYSYVFYLYHDYDLNKFTQQIKQELPDDKLPVMGNPNSWYALHDQDRQFRAYTSKVVNLEWKEFYIIQNEEFFKWTGHTKAWDEINTMYPSEIISSFEVNGERINIRHYSENIKY